MTPGPARGPSREVRERTCREVGFLLLFLGLMCFLTSGAENISNLRFTGGLLGIGSLGLGVALDWPAPGLRVRPVETVSSPNSCQALVYSAIYWTHILCLVPLSLHNMQRCWQHKKMEGKNGAFDLPPHTIRRILIRDVGEATLQGVQR